MSFAPFFWSFKSTRMVINGKPSLGLNHLLPVVFAGKYNRLIHSCIRWIGVRENKRR